ncbi:MAG: hypothetical protein CSA49_07665 [Gammaproteobacteria bacterium]|nr:MAG: hypothetical protein CSA49_07665 [Gammaproteobacteria bacterium]
MTNKAKTLHIYKDIAQISIDRTIETAESIHQTVFDFVMDMATTGISDQNTIDQLKAMPRKNISRTYQFARDINSQVGHAVSEALSACEHKDNVKFLTQDKP